MTDFETFWKLYDKKVDRKKAEHKWKALSEGVKPAILEHVKIYVTQTFKSVEDSTGKPWMPIRKDPCTYLNNRSWENEVKADKKKSGFKWHKPYRPPDYQEQLELTRKGYERLKEEAKGKVHKQATISEIIKKQLGYE